MEEQNSFAVQEDNRILYITLLLLTVFALFLLLRINLLPAFLAGLLVFNLVEVVTPLLGRIGIVPAIGKALTLVIISIIIITVITLSMMGFASFFNSGASEFIAMLQNMADTIATARSHLPGWLKEYIPENVKDIQIAASDWLRKHAFQLSHIGKNIGIVIIYILMGMIIGGMIAYSALHKTKKSGPMTVILAKRADLINKAFRRIVFSQAKISLINTFFTAIFLAVIFPLFGTVLPFTKTLIIITFIVGLLPVIGNLISNTVIVLVGLNVSVDTAIAALTFLVIIHKLEYFLNAHIIGYHTSSSAWEIIVAMLIMEALFGISGIIAAPIYYAYLKEELSKAKLI